MGEHEEISIIDEINRLVAADPFITFTIVMASGQQYTVGARDAVAVTRSTVTVVPHQGGHHFLRQNQISEVSVPAEAQ